MIGMFLVSMLCLSINLKSGLGKEISTLGHLTSEIRVILEVYPLIFLSFLLFSLKFINIHDKYFSYYTLR